MRYTMAMDFKNGSPLHEFSQEEISTIFGNKDWEAWQKQLIRILVENKAAMTVKNSRGNEIFYCTFSRYCIDQICYSYSNSTRFMRFINYINKNNK